MRVLALTSLFLAVTSVSAYTNENKLYSVLWGVDGELWVPNNSSLLYDFTDVGYKLGNEAIPEYPVGVSVLDFGAVPDDDDDIYDVQAFRDAIAACPQNHTVFVPNGRYVIDDKLELDATSSNVVIRGESRDGTILYFPKHMSEILQTDRAPAGEKFISFIGGSNRGMENLSLVLRDEQKATGYFRDPAKTKQFEPHWFYSGEALIRFRDGETDSWLRNVYIKNSNHAISVGGQQTKQISLIDIVLDQFISRKSGADSVDGHMGIHVGSGATYCLVHNIFFTGIWSHDLAIMGTQHSVFSRIKGPNLELDHHAQGNSGNLFTEIDTGLGGRGYGESSNNFNETYWGIQGIREGRLLDPSRKCTFVGINIDANNSIGNDWHHEPLDPCTLEPANIYLAQMAKNTPGKHAPPDVALSVPPSPFLDKVVKFLPTEDAYYDKNKADNNYGFQGSVTIKKTRREGFVKFDLSDLENETVYHARLKLYLKITLKTTFNLQVRTMSNVSWTEETLTYNTRPTPTGDTIISETFLTKTDLPDWAWFDLDITDTVNNILGSTESILSLNFQGGGSGHNKDAIVSFKSKDGFNPCHLVVYRGSPNEIFEQLPTDDTFFDKYNPTKFYGFHQNVLAKKNRREGFMKFDLGGPEQVESAILNLYGRVSLKDNFNLQIFNMTDTSWTEETLNYTNRPFGDSIIAERYMNLTSYSWHEFNITDTVNGVLDSVGSIISLNFQGGGVGHNKDAIFAIRSKDDIELNHPLLVITRTKDVSAPPTRPTGLVTSMNGNSSVTLTWDDVGFDPGWPLTYNVYRYDDDGYVVKGMGLTTTSFTDYRLTPGNDYLLPITYVVTATDIAGSESAQSENATTV